LETIPVCLLDSKLYLGLHQKPIEHERAALRLALLILPAVFVTLWAMLDSIDYHHQFASISTLANTMAKKTIKIKSLASVPGYGYESVILLQPAVKKQMIFPFSAPGLLLAPEKSRPLVIRFDSPYWYLQPPDIRPGPMAHKAHGTLPVRKHQVEQFNSPHHASAPEPGRKHPLGALLRHSDWDRKSATIHPEPSPRRSS
jgi:hypothetical protein